MPAPRTDPTAGCRKCPRLVAFRRENKVAYPAFHNGPVLTWGVADSRLLIVGLAPGLKGANRSGRPFTGDASGDLLFASLFRAGLASQAGGAVSLHDCAITNAVACVPPQNRPTAEEVATCRPFLAAKLKKPRVVLALGKLAHDSVLRALEARVADYPFSHGAVARIAQVMLVSSYHPSRYNVSTKRINAEMMDAAVGLCLR